MRKKITKMLRWFFLFVVLSGMTTLFLQAREMTSRPEGFAQMKQVFVR